MLLKEVSGTANKEHSWGFYFDISDVLSMQSEERLTAAYTITTIQDQIHSSTKRIYAFN